jgi:hypothetical protein
MAMTTNGKKIVWVNEVFVLASKIYECKMYVTNTVADHVNPIYFEDATRDFSVFTKVKTLCRDKWLQNYNGPIVFHEPEQKNW